ncbi:hydrogenase expression/formation protein [Hydrogenobacter thermophilus TK-6]|uniref:Hydrogenase maturation protease n=2 Tax=Hydrogenobacter thermophilus TaxID=940 RepID=D3DI17_HYDTT|nr:HyaD/HybD family hydrogenase maturation endopeptidase [Hydrogenobacter thermophilus]ADO45402.1 hydrogenase expression/formation protein [Hydrogenobacter thermophilus TK-6]BAF73677.1 hydrogenase maturation protease [Hydrogenobacter thermophilus TK-6]BAI69469.1 hydrogenase maturation protease [Hydrogenobacter thermophilus TK-6]
MRTLLLGIGNILLSDEGLGVRAVEELKSRFKFPPYVELMDGGTLGMDLLYFMEGFERLLVIDAVLGGNPPGTLYKFNDEEVKAYFKRKVSAHELGFQEILALAVLLGKRPKEIVLVGMEPESLNISLELSTTVKERLHLLIEEVLKQLEDWGIEYEELEHTRA